MITSPNDRKEYRPITLSNGLRVLLIQTPLEHSKSAVSLAVNVGHFDDPIEHPGLAHFAEHLFFLGSKHFPKAGSFQQFINRHGGTHNAYTSTEISNFYFDVDTDFLPNALTHFADLFISPLLEESAIDSERQAVDAEFKLKLQDDSRRFYQVQKETVNPAHPFAKFSVGNAETLGADNTAAFKQELREFVNEHYVAQRMTLVVFSPAPLDAQESLVTQIFSHVKAGTVKPAYPDTPMYTDEQVGISIEIKPHQTIYKQIVCFALPSIVEMYSNKLVNFLAHLLGFEGKGSILSLLKTKGWANGLSAGGGVSGYNFKDFTINVELTKTGLSHREDVVELIFAYLYKIQTSPELIATLFQDKKLLSETAFTYQEKSKPISMVSHLATNMQHYPEPDYIYADFRMDDLDFCALKELLCLFVPENMRLIAIYPNAKVEKTAKWYGTEYSFTPICKALVARCTDQLQGKLNSDFDALSLPHQNPYLARHLIMQPNENPKEVPEIIKQSEGINIWHKQDTWFEVPKGHMYLAFDCNKAVQSVRTLAITRLFTELFIDSVIEENYYAELAGLNYHLYVHQGGLTLHSSGLSAKQPQLVKSLTENLFTPKLNPKRFKQIHAQLLRHWQNSEKNKPVAQLFGLITSTLQPNNPSMSKLATHLPSITFDEANAFHQALFSEIHLEAFAYGNWNREQTNQFADYIVDGLFCDTRQPTEEILRPLLSIQNEGNIHIQKLIENADHGIVLYYQSADISYAGRARMMLLNHMLSTPFFQQLRTEKQLGYLVGTGYIPLNQYPGLALYIQSPNYQPEQLLDAIDTFLASFVQNLHELPDATWQQYQSSIMGHLLENASNLKARSQRLWHAIANRSADFNEKRHIADAVKQLTLKDLCNFAQQQLLSVQSSRMIATTQTSVDLADGKSSIQISHLKQQLPYLTKGSLALDCIE